MKQTSLNPAMRQALNFGIIGYGRLAREYYAPALAGMKEVKVAAIADPLEQSPLCGVPVEAAARVYENHLQMLQQEKLDAVPIRRRLLLATRVCGWQLVSTACQRLWKNHSR